MPLADFVHLRTHSAYSLSAGAIKVKELVQLCRAEAMPAVAITDTGNLFGALEFAMACVDAGVQPIIGCEIALRRDEGSRAQRGMNGAAVERDRIVLRVQSEVRYRKLMDLGRRSFLDSESDAEPAVTLADIAESNAGLICLAGGARGPLGRLIAEGQVDAAEALLVGLKEAFPGRLYIEVQRHGMPEQMRVESGLVDLAYQHDLPLVATNDSYFPNRDFYEAHDALLCIAEGRAVADQDRRRLTPDHFFRPAGEMRALFADLPEACDNTLVIARRCAFIPQSRKPILPPFATAEGLDEESALREAACFGLEARLSTQIFRSEMTETEREVAAEPYRARLQFELDMIVKTG